MKEIIYIKPFLSYGAYVYNVNNIYYTAHEYTLGIAGKGIIDNFAIDYMVYFGQNMYLNSSMGGYSGFLSSINPINLENNNIEISNYYSLGGGLSFSYKYNKFLFQIGAGLNSNFNKDFKNTQLNTGSYINMRYYITDIFFNTFRNSIFRKYI